MSAERIAAMLGVADSPERNFPPTEVYNEGWMLRLVLDWFSRNRGVEFDLQFSPESRWYSEALLPSAFLTRKRGDKLAESWTHADGVIGQFTIGANRAGDLTLPASSGQFIVTEAKMFSGLSKGVKNADYYNQAARNVACMAEVASRAGIDPRAFQNLGFFVIAPQSQIDAGVFEPMMSRMDIQEVVGRRVSEYEDLEKNAWFEERFMPLLERVSLRSISWEEIVGVVRTADSASGAELLEFYVRCLEFNQPASQK